MQVVDECLVCGHSQFELLLKYPSDPYFKKLVGLVDQGVQYFICTNCGFVFQNPTLTGCELESLYAVEYRPDDPPEDYQSLQRRLGQRVVQYVDRHVGKVLPYRRVLDIGCAAGFFLEAFHKEGWEVVGLDANTRWTKWGREHLGLDLRDGFYDSNALSGEQFSLIVFSHVLEHLPNPFSTLARIREHLCENGVLMLGAPNILRPHFPVLGKILAGPHVCLYSTRTVALLLDKAGYEVIYQDNWYPRGLRVLAKPSKASKASQVKIGDNWKIILKLYQGLLRPDACHHFERNLAALIPTHMDTLEELARKDLLQHHRLVRQDDGTVNLFVKTGSGFQPFVSQSTTKGDSGHDMGGKLVHGAPGALIVQVGLGTGEFSRSLLPTLAAHDQRLLICEPDPAVVLAALSNHDWTHLLTSDRVRLVTGSQVRLSDKLRQWIQPESSFVVVMDPWVSDRWSHRYGPVQEYFKTGSWKAPHVVGWKFSFAA